MDNPIDTITVDEIDAAFSIDEQFTDAAKNGMGEKLNISVDKL